MAARIEAGVRVPETQDTASKKASQAPASLSNDQVNDLRSLLATVVKEGSSEFSLKLNTCLKDGRDLTAEERVNIDKYLEQRAAVDAWSGQGSSNGHANLSGPMKEWYRRKPVRPNERAVSALAIGVGYI